MDLDIENVPTCQFDYLEFIDGLPFSGAQNMSGHLCGTLNTTFAGPYNSSDLVATVYFHSDFSKEFGGFKIMYNVVTQQATTFSPMITTTPSMNFSTTQFPSDLPWVRSEDLMGFWPLSKHHSLNDVTGKSQPCYLCRGLLNENSTGPFGQRDTSFRTNGHDGILDVNFRTANMNEITISMFVKASDDFNGTQGLLNFNSFFQVQLQTNENGSISLVVLDTYEPSRIYANYDVIKRGQWTFFALTIENSLWSPCMISLYSQHGLYYRPLYKEHLCNHFEDVYRFELGSTDIGGGMQFHRNNLGIDNAVSCMSIYRSVLKESEIRSVYEMCRAAHQTPPSGAPMIPFPAIPQQDKTIPKYGQFPWIASIRMNDQPNVVRCSAIIYDSYFLITSASCLRSNSSEITVRTGDYDANYVEPFETSHRVARIQTHPLGVDIGLIQLKDPINFENNYVNTMEMPEFGDNVQNNADWLDDPKYFYGWGDTGRLSLINKGYPRYFMLRFASHQECTKTYPNDYNPYYSMCFYSEPTLEKAEPCHRDEGGPMMVPGTDIHGNMRLEAVCFFIFVLLKY